MAAADKSLSQLRVQIDAIDNQLLLLLNKRARLASEVGNLKRARAADTSFYVPHRERVIIDRMKEANTGPFPTSAIRPVFQEIISACLSLEAAVTVAYLGPQATFTHQAVRRHFGTSARTIPCNSIEAVFAEVERGQAEFGVVPVENSTEGVVNHTLDSFLDVELAITAEIVVAVDQCLLAQAGTQLATIDRVYSHPQALAQCRGWLSKNLPKAAQVETHSTASAAQAAAKEHNTAAIAAELATRVYGLQLLRAKLQDVSENITRFLVINKTCARSLSIPTDGAPTDLNYKTSMVLSLPDQALPDRAGSLHDVLQPIAARGINLTRIESRPTRRKAWDYVFFLDLDGHVADPNVAELVDELTRICQLCKVLGCYQKADTYE